MRPGSKRQKNFNSASEVIFPIKKNSAPTSANLKLEEIININELQKIMDDFYNITQFGVAIVDMNGKILVSRGWQEICTKFHRIHPKTNKNCIESDIELTTSLNAGRVKAYKCKNNLWDLSTPIIIAGKQYGNIFLGQFFYKDEKPDYDLFRRQAKEYGFDEKEYITALDKVPRWSRSEVKNVMQLYSKLAIFISELSFSNLTLAQSLEKIQKSQDIITAKNKELKLAQQIATIGNWSMDPAAGLMVWSEEMYHIYDHDKRLGPFTIKDYKKIVHGKWLKKFTEAVSAAIYQGKPYDLELKLELPSGKIKWIHTICEPEPKRGLKGHFLRGTVQDITKSKEAKAELTAIMEMSPAMIAVLKMKNSCFNIVNPAFKKVLGYDEDEFIDRSIYDYIHPEDVKKTKARIEQFVQKNGNIINIENRCRSKKGHYRWLNWLIKPYEEMGLIYAVAIDITKSKKATEDLEKIKWMLSPNRISAGDPLNNQPVYGDLAEIASDREIQDALGKETLRELVGDFLNMLETSSAVYEKNGDYALGIMSSDWCSYLDSASRKLCNTDDNADALNSGKWLCHESCWNSASKQTMVNRAPVDIKCPGGIRLYAVPIYAGDEVVGAINFGYGAPPKEEAILTKIATRYKVPVETLKEKAAQYQIRPPFLIEIAKKRLQTTAMIIGEAVLKNRYEKALSKSESLYRTLAENFPNGALFLINRDYEYMAVDGKALNQFGVDKKNLIGKKIMEVFPDMWDELSTHAKKIWNGQEAYFEIDFMGRKLSNYGVPIKEDSEKPDKLLIIVQDITERKRTEKALEESENRYRTLVMQSADCLILHDLDGNIIDINECAIKTYEYGREELQSMNISQLDPDYDDRASDGAFYESLIPGQPVSFEARQITKSGREFPVEVRLSIVDMGGKYYIQGLCRDISERRRAENEQRKLQEQLQQAIKMESVGRLAGGVAHDFNNMLNVILGYSDMALHTITPADRFYDEFNEIREAAKRSADLTKQLLAFARKQTVTPQILDLNQAIKKILKMLIRLIGENIELDWQPKENIGHVFIDPAQIDQILTNLVVNARDAISQTGRIIIETDETELNEYYCKHHLGFIPGNYATFSVTDNGKGMSKETKAHIFEPFYTTKPTGQGTGLGLSTVYGIVKQNKGFVNVYSEPGEGTTFKIYLPKHKQDKGQQKANHSAEKLKPGNETILIVEDEEAILNLAVRMLKSLGYHVLSASRPSDAMRIAKEYSGHIDLLLTDVIMPEMNGRDLASRLLTVYPEIKLIFMSGYTANIITYEGKLETDMHFIQKPFSIRQISAKLREILEN